MQKRSNYIDFYKFLGLSLIILAHVGPPSVIFELRSVDVPFMLFASGLAFSGKIIDNYKAFVIPRTKRLVFPVYIFLFFYFLIEILFDYYEAKCISLDFTKIACSFLLLNTKAIHFVWVIRVFLLLTLVTPFILRLDRKISNKQWLSIILLLSAILEVINHSLPHILTINKPIYYCTYEIVPFTLAYSLPFWVGIRVRFASQSLIRYLFVLFTLLFVTILCFKMWNGADYHVTHYKYPPYFYFVSFGTIIAIAMWLLRGTLLKLSTFKFVTFYGSHTIWIYLWHIPMLSLSNLFCMNWWQKYIVVYCLSVALFYIQFLLVCAIEKKYSYSFLKYLKS